MIESVKLEISKIDFESVYNEAYLFSKKINKQFSNLHLPEDIIVEDQLPTSKVCRKKNYMMKYVKTKFQLTQKKNLE